MNRPAWANRGVGAAPPQAVRPPAYGNYGPCRNNIAGGQRAQPFPPQPPHQKPAVAAYAAAQAARQQPVRPPAPQHIAARNAKGASSLPAMEAQFTQGADSLYEGLMDLAMPTTQLATTWKELLTLRSQLQQAHNVMVRSPAGAGGGVHWGGMQQMGMLQDWGQPEPAAGVENQKTEKSLLRELYDKKVRKEEQRAVDKDEVVYETTEAEGGGYISQVQLGPEERDNNIWHAAVEPQKSKKEAEQAAARVALRDLFPGAAMQQPAAQAHGKKVAAAAAGGGGGGGGGPPPAKKGQPPEEPKARLIWAVQLLLGQPSIPKTTIVYEVTEVEDPTGEGRYQASVTIPEFDSARLWHGEPKATKKAAEASAAEFAYADVQTDVAPLAAEYFEKKKQKNAENLKLLKERHAEKKAAKKGDAESGEGGAEQSMEMQM